MMKPTLKPDAFSKQPKLERTLKTPSRPFMIPKLLFFSLCVALILAFTPTAISAEYLLAALQNGGKPFYSTSMQKALQDRNKQKLIVDYAGKFDVPGIGERSFTIVFTFTRESLVSAKFDGKFFVNGQEAGTCPPDIGGVTLYYLSLTRNPELKASYVMNGGAVRIEVRPGGKARFADETFNVSKISARMPLVGRDQFLEESHWGPMLQFVDARWVVSTDSPPLVLSYDAKSLLRGDRLSGKKPAVFQLRLTDFRFE